MAGKRRATNDLNHDNWDKEEEPEDSGNFQRADDNTIKGRVIKTAKRRNIFSKTTDSEEPKNNPFGTFKGFNSGPATNTQNASHKPSFDFLKNLSNEQTGNNGDTQSAKQQNTTTTKPSFNFLSNFSNKTEQPVQQNGDPNSQNATLKSSFSFLSNRTDESVKNGDIETSESKDKSAVTLDGSANLPSDNSSESKEYFAKLKGLNESVSNWVKKHVDLNPFINLQPVFKDYEKYFEEIEKERKNNASASTNGNTTKKGEQPPFSSVVFKASTNTPEKPKESMISTTAEVAKKIESSATPTFSFGSTNSATSFGSAASNFSFGNTNKDSGAGFTFGNNMKSGQSSSFSFSSSAPFSFGNVKKPEATEELIKNTEEEDEDQPPKVEFTPVIEENHLYTVRCKVFVKKDGAFGDRGVGNLFLKKIADNNKVQLIVRADTNLGNLLCNFILSENIPIQRLGKKDVMLVCLPTPDTKPPPVPMLLRVKSPEEADNLLAILQKHKK